MENIFQIKKVKLKDKKSSLKAEAKSNVKSTKYFPIFEIDGQKMIFKPLSKTKPLTTPLFAFSEVFWSYIINKYFDNLAPRYFLAQVDEEIERKYYKKGVLVESITSKNEKLINLYDYFMKHPDPKVDIKDYINYCMINYDYTQIMSSNLIKENPKIGEEISRQILLSILRQDQNFHYENINFKEKENIIEVAPPIDFEFSNFFLYPDLKEEYNYYQNKYKKELEISFSHTEEDKVIREIKREFGLNTNSPQIENIIYIVKNYPYIIEEFINKLDYLIKNFSEIKLLDNDNFIKELNSSSWEIGHALYKNHDIEEYKKLQKEIKLIKISKEDTFQKILQDIYTHMINLRLVLKIYLYSFKNDIELDFLSLKDIYDKMNVDYQEKLEDIDLTKNKMYFKSN